MCKKLLKYSEERENFGPDSSHFLSDELWRHSVVSFVIKQAVLQVASDGDLRQRLCTDDSYTTGYYMDDVEQVRFIYHEHL